MYGIFSIMFHLLLKYQSFIWLLLLPCYIFTYITHIELFTIVSEKKKKNKKIKNKGQIAKSKNINQMEPKCSLIICELFLLHKFCWTNMSFTLFCMIVLLWVKNPASGQNSLVGIKDFMHSLVCSLNITSIKKMLWWMCQRCWITSVANEQY